ncbi:MAG TPA: serine hydrolase domain-containing protein [Candidatus Acidoferrales bacterium]|nr:serine hydrolase domain-containing protein [Candidatus Acidoferrales bacterium]
MPRLRRFARRSLPLGSILALSFLCSCGGGQPAPPPPTPKSLPELQQDIQAILTRSHVPGAGIALVDKDHVIWAGGVGMAQLASNKPVTADTVFRVGSISKTFVSLALLKLQEAGRIDLNAKLRDFSPTLPFENRWESTHPVTLAEVLEHSAGFDDMSASETYDLRPNAAADPLDVCFQFPQPLATRWPPGTRMSYSNPGYGVAGFLVQKASSEKFDLYIAQNILQPLGMTRSSFDLDATIYQQLAQGYHGIPPRPVPYLNIYLRPAGDFKSSPAELAKLVEMFLNRGKVGDEQLVSADSITRMEYPQTTLAAKAGLKYGYGFGNYSNLDGPVVQHGHDGGISGFLSTYSYMPDQAVGYVALINSDSGGQALRQIDRLLANYLLAGQALPQPPAAAMPDAQLAQFTGYYEKENPRGQMLAFLDILLHGERVSLANGRLTLKDWTGPARVLAPTGNNQFRLESEAGPSMIFLTDDEGNEILSGAGGFYGVRRGVWWPMLRFLLVHLALVAMLSSLLFTLWWIPVKLLKKTTGKGHLWVRGMPALAALSLGGAFWLFNSTPVWLLGSYNMYSVGLWLLTWLFAAFSVLGLVLAWRARWQGISRAVYWHSLIVSIACCGMTLYLAYWHMIGVKLWLP